LGHRFPDRLSGRLAGGRFDLLQALPLQNLLLPNFRYIPRMARPARVTKAQTQKTIFSVWTSLYVWFDPISESPFRNSVQAFSHGFPRHPATRRRAALLLIQHCTGAAWSQRGLKIYLSRRTALARWRRVAASLLARPTAATSRIQRKTPTGSSVGTAPGRAACLAFLKAAARPR
jgi:hypothetical protein